MGGGRPRRQAQARYQKGTGGQLSDTRFHASGVGQVPASLSGFTLAAVEPFPRLGTPPGSDLWAPGPHSPGRAAHHPGLSLRGASLDATGSPLQAGEVPSARQRGGADGAGGPDSSNGSGSGGGGAVNNGPARRRAGAVRQRSFYIASANGEAEDEDELQRASSTARHSLDSAPGSRRSSNDTRRGSSDARSGGGAADGTRSGGTPDPRSGGGRGGALPVRPASCGEFSSLLSSQNHPLQQQHSPHGPRGDPHGGPQQPRGARGTPSRLEHVSFACSDACGASDACGGAASDPGGLPQWLPADGLTWRALGEEFDCPAAVNGRRGECPGEGAGCRKARQSNGFEQQQEQGEQEDPQQQQHEEEEEIEYVLDDTPMHVEGGLWIGSMLAERERKKLRGAAITDVLQVAEGLYPNHPLHFNYMNIQVQDRPGEDLVVHFPRCFAFIDDALKRKGNVLVHCAGGVSRSATVVLGYLMARRNLSFDQALTVLRRVRPWVQPNPGFVGQLRAFEELSCDLPRWRGWSAVCTNGGSNGYCTAGCNGGGDDMSMACTLDHASSGKGSSGCGGEGGDGLQCVVSIPPPVGVAAAANGGRGGGSMAAGALAAELLEFARLHVGGGGGSAGRASLERARRRALTRGGPPAQQEQQA